MNYIELKGKGIINKYFAFVDNEDLSILRICQKKNVFLKVVDGYYNKDKFKDYYIYICKVKKKNVDILKEIFGLLENSMLILGYTDYNDVCEQILNMLKEGVKNDK